VRKRAEEMRGHGRGIVSAARHHELVCKRVPRHVECGAAVPHAGGLAEELEDCDDAVECVVVGAFAQQP